MLDEKAKTGLASRSGRLINIALLLLVAGLGMVAFFSLLELLLTAAAHIIVATNDSATRSRYALVTVRNLWLLIGGAGLVAFVIFCLDYSFKHWREARMTRLFTRILAVEVVIIGLQILVAG